LWFSVKQALKIRHLEVYMTRQKSNSASVKFPGWDSDAFASRLMEAAGDKKPYSLQRETGIAESLIRKYMSGQSIPGADKLALLARATGVTMDWLATGKDAGEKDDTEQLKARAALDLEALERVLGMVRKAEDTHQARLSGVAAARVVRMLYGWVQNNQVPLTQKIVDDVVEAQAGHDL
jgi:transcriptional regulator with XRE-family HTH domain